ncbi:TonB-dependent receptor plug domain-containing protein [Sphingomonas immobilis]|uniref:TonB-dependent receptor n=1 Tax=Sphingomonas immobilis TaxID=3063997 RepID=A0ABT8ZWL0_9SPHN|nr:TonB-dependent receptor [Sphingomonas sp. CA1-15]MDO7841965.1 TonB-dependent receptor [Sphingomonas sp. CA1-15]
MIKNSISLLALAVASIAATPAFAAPADAPAALAPDAPPSDATVAPDDEKTDVIVLGTRRTDRTVTSSASPIDVISATELTNQPSGNMLDIVKNIIPSFYVPQNTITDASTFVRAPSLRGLPASEVLVMINGKRYNRSALVQVAGGSDTALSAASQGADISLIPAIAVGNLQVLRDGATAQYGSDAIAGVLNYGLKEKTGIELQARYGQYYQNGDGKSVQVAGDVGFGIGDLGFINIAGEYNNDGQTSRGVTRPSAVFLAQAQPGVVNRIPNYPGPAQIWGSSPTESYKFFVNSALNVTDSSKIYLFANYARSKATQSFNYRPVLDWSFPTTTGIGGGSANDYFKKIYYLTPCPAGNATCPTGGFVRDANNFQFTSVYPGGFTPQFVGVSEQFYGTLGYKGSAGDFTYDLSGTYAKNTLDLSMFGSLNGSYGPQSQTSFKFGALQQEEINANIDLSYPIEVGFASPLTISGGGEFRQEKYTLTAGDVQSYGAGPYASAQTLYTLVSPGVYSLYTPTDPRETQGQSPGASGYGGTSPDAAGSWTQRSFAAYVDLETDIVENLSVGAAGRYENYNTFGGSWVGKFNAIWKATDFLSVRGTIGNGFHAPSPGQSHTSILTTAFNNGVQTQTGTYPVDTAISRFYGAVPLRPETSMNYGFGVVLSPAQNLKLTIDAYQIDVSDRIGVSKTFNVTAANIAAQPALAAVGVGGSVQYFTNDFDTRTRGIDVVATYKTSLSEAIINFTLAYNYNKTEVTRPGSSISSDQILDIEHGAPNHRAVFTTNWALGPLSINFRENFYSWWKAAISYGPAQTFGSKFVSDLDVTYNITENYSVTVGGQNILDERPDKLSPLSNSIFPITGGSSDGQIYPSSGGPFGLNGGFWYVRLRAKY